jgi:hypothetical protein
MSIQLLAQKLQSEGRNGDSLLVHMTPSEVGGLQALAKASGGSLTVNPKTGLVEANFLESILPTILGIGLSFVPGVGPLAAGALVGGGTALATGSLEKGLLAGLGAAGGSGLGTAFQGLGSAAPTIGAAIPTPAVGSTAVTAGTGIGGSTIPTTAQITSQAANVGGQSLSPTLQNVARASGASIIPPAPIASASGSPTITNAANLSGQVAQTPASIGGFFADNLTNIGMAAAPALGGFLEQPAPEEDDSMIRPYTYSEEVNPLFGMPGQSYYSSQSFTPQTPVPASGFSGFKQGGITSLAVGGESRYQQPTRTVDPAVTEYNQQLMQRAQKEYVQTPQLGAFQSALPNAGAYNPEMGAAYQQAQAAKQEAMKKIQANQFGYQYDPERNTTIQTQPTEDQFTLLQRQMEELRSQQNSLQDNYGFNQSDGEYANGGITRMADGGMFNLGSYSDGGRLLKGPGDGVSDSIPATIEGGQPARLADGEFVVPARIVGELGNGSTEAGARQLYAMMDRISERRKKSMGIENIAVDTESYKDLPA